MRIIDSHLHVDRMMGKDVEAISMAGVEVGILPTPHLLQGLASTETLIMLWRRLLDFEVKHAKSLGIDMWVTLSIPFYGVEAEAREECLKQLPKYLEHENVVGMGEIGLDAGIDDEVKLFRAQLNIAKEHNLPVIVHTPTPLEPQASTVIKQIISVINEEKFPIERVVLDHTGRKTLQDRLDCGAMVGLSVCYDKLRPDDAAEIVFENPDNRGRFLINSEFGHTHEGYFSIPRVVLAMRRLGLEEEEREKVTWDNPKRFFNLPIK